jgi:hypothetical protein
MLRKVLKQGSKSFSKAILPVQYQILEKSSEVVLKEVGWNLKNKWVVSKTVD